MLIERLEALQLPDVELLTDFQLQVEFALDLQGRQQIIFIDASLNAGSPFEFTPVAAEEDNSYTSHALSPGAVLHAYQKLFGEPPLSYVLAIRGEAFELGEGLSEAAKTHLEVVLGWLCQRLLETAMD
jgi:hydrogenase maturation protease